MPYLDVAPYMPEYYKPQNLLDFEERLPSSDSLSLHSFTSLTSTNLEWDDSAIAPSSEGKVHCGSLTPILFSYQIHTKTPLQFSLLFHFISSDCLVYYYIDVILLLNIYALHRYSAAILLGTWCNLALLELWTHA